MTTPGGRAAQELTAQTEDEALAQGQALYESWTATMTSERKAETNWNVKGNGR